MNVYEPDPQAHQRLPLNELQDLFLVNDGHRRKRLQERQDFLPVFQIPAGQFPNDKGMPHHLSIVEQGLQAGLPLPEMADPDRGVDQDHVLCGSSAGDPAQLFLSSAQPCEALCAFLGDQSLEP